ncbi:catalytic protein, partial [Aspergillus niger ATCC 1015]
NPDAERLLLHLPGGAYCLPALPSHIDYSTSILKGLEQAGIDAGMLFLPYELTPTAQYPHQMKQAVALLQYVIEDLGKLPSDIVLLGDSAGAHLILSVLSHLAHPHPHILPYSCPDSYNQPAGAPGGWWRDLPVEEIFIGVGGQEILYDSIIKTARKIKAEHTGVTIGIAHLEVHCEALSPFNPGMMSPDQYKALLAWLKGSLCK